MKKSFIGFEQWLVVVCEQAPNNAASIVSALRKVEPLLSETNVLKGETNAIRGLYGKLADIVPLSNKERAKALNGEFGIKRKIHQIFKIVVEEPKMHNKIRDLVKTNKEYSSNNTIISRFKTAFIHYLRFLEYMFNLFTVEELREEGVIKIERLKKLEIRPNEMISAKYFQEGVIGLLIKTGMFLKKDNKTVIAILDKFSEAIQELCEARGAKRNDALRLSSFICQSYNVAAFNWRDAVFKGAKIYCEDGQEINWSDIRQVVFHPHAAELRLFPEPCSDHDCNQHSYRVIPLQSLYECRPTKFGIDVYRKHNTDFTSSGIKQSIRDTGPIEKYSYRFYNSLRLSIYDTIGSIKEVMAEIGNYKSDSNTSMPYKGKCQYDWEQIGVDVKNSMVELADLIFNQLEEYSNQFEIHLVAE